MLFPETGLFHIVFRRQAASGTRGDDDDLRQNEIALKLCNGHIFLYDVLSMCFMCCL